MQHLPSPVHAGYRQRQQTDTDDPLLLHNRVYYSVFLSVSSVFVSVCIISHK